MSILIDSKLDTIDRHLMTQGIEKKLGLFRHCCIDLLPGQKIFSNSFHVIKIKPVAKHVDT